jgi:hypothetical protein
VIWVFETYPLIENLAKVTSWLFVYIMII